MEQPKITANDISEAGLQKLIRGLKIFQKSNLVKEYFPIYFLAIFFTFNKSVQEGLINEISVTMKEYYFWGGQSVGFLLFAMTPLSKIYHPLPPPAEEQF